jgi:hypothetical protein
VSTDDGLNVAAELAELRGAMETGFARLEGQLNLINQAQSRTTQDMKALEDRVAALEARRMPMGVLAAASGAVSAVVAGAALLIR